MGCTGSAMRPYSSSLAANLAHMQTDSLRAHLKAFPRDVHGYDPNLMQGLGMQVSLVQMLVTLDRLDLLEIVLALKPRSLHFRNDAGSAVEQAVSMGRTAIALVLVRHGCDPTERDAEGRGKAALELTHNEAVRAALLQAWGEFKKGAPPSSSSSSSLSSSSSAGSAGVDAAASQAQSPLPLAASPPPPPLSSASASNQPNPLAVPPSSTHTHTSPAASAPAAAGAAEAEEAYVEHTFASRWKMGKKLGEGAFATVHLCTSTHDPSRVAAVKMMHKERMSAGDESGARREVAVMRKLHHPNIVQFLDYFDEGGHLYLILEYLQGGELFERILQKEHYSEKEARDTIFVFLSALKHMHDRGIVHRDLKPENLLMASESDDADVKIADFGLSVEDDGKLREVCGSPSYMSPELLKGQPYGKPVDMWALGVITYILIGGYPPFDQGDDAAVIRGRFEFHPDCWQHVSLAAKHLIRGLLSVDPTARLTCDQALDDPWIRTAGADLAGRNLATSLARFKEFHGKRKLKGAVKGVMAVNRMKKVGGAGSGSEGGATPKSP